ncbi:MAG TPA: bacillithiol biosynthesis deacetylase BshB1 [Vicinamibacterales bacterium]|nr:bacillithiol biosynthesis deacetylase BshB1 [Vicinamibacterales bacterium]
MPLDLLVFGPHPDDIEIGLGGAIARHAAGGLSVGLCDLTAGELGSNGTPDERRREADEAAGVLGVRWRENLGWPDGGITGTDAQLRSAAALIRAHQPRAIAVPHWDDRHPDHRAASAVLDVAVFKAGLRRFEAPGGAWQPEWVCYYFINDGGAPSFVVDVSGFYETKRRALACYRSQFTPADRDAVATRLSSPTFARLIETRDGQFGALAGVSFAEGVVVREPVARESLLKSRP